MSVPPPADDSQSLAVRFPSRATRWKLRTRSLNFDRRPLLMGIVNVTPDSFSDGGRFFDHTTYDPQLAIEQGLKLATEGADILDIGGESTRPYSEPVPADEELRRVLPIVEALCRQTSLPISIDTSKAIVARAALAVGAEIINDITGLRGDPAMLPLTAESGAGVCAMHIQGTPQTMQDNPTYADVVADVLSCLKECRDELQSGGVEPGRIALDPGIGFGKTHQHNLTLLAHCGAFHDLGCPLLVGHSRKGFIGKVLGDKKADRTFGTIGTALSLARKGVQILRVHDVGAVREALLLFEATGGIDGQPWILS